MSAVFCTICLTRDHATRDCENVVCFFCRRTGHQMRDCRRRRCTEQLAIHFPFAATVGAAVTPRSMRDMPNLGMFLRSLPDMAETVEGHNQFYSVENQLRIDYGQSDEIVISLQSGNDNEETLIRITPSRIKVAAKYSIMNGELYEDHFRDAFGNRNTVTPAAAAYVLLICNEMWNSTVCFQSGNTKYYIEWQKLNGRPSAVVSSTYMYHYRRTHPEMVGNLRLYFEGPRRADPPPMIAQTNPENNAAANVNDNIDEIDLNIIQQAAHEQRDGLPAVENIVEAIVEAIADEEPINDPVADAEQQIAHPITDNNVDNGHGMPIIDGEVLNETAAPMSPESSQFFNEQFALEDTATAATDDTQSDDENLLAIDEDVSVALSETAGGVVYKK